ncbi:glutaminase [Agrococcus sp. ARC_14]|uniref:glutaminase n=1 Tax=Agrococcus sp. ARC_14 TaxID=2919927 RepID=UPI001F067E91|nr:glutaminase [Agrococcus sp. ARC_14]MCH1881739.1 glutaminase [Agrococcus sp. ARC_14]
MRSPVSDYLEEVRGSCMDGGDEGQLASYIPELAAVDPDRFAIALCTVDGTVYAVGDVEQRFTIQSMSKPFAYALALADRGLAGVLEHVGVEPSGDAFNEISMEDDGRPRNPMVNIGAITTHALVGPPEATAEQSTARVIQGLSAFAGRQLEVDEQVFASERETADRNMALAYLVRAQGKLEDDPRDAVDGYTRQCSLQVDVRDLAVMAMTLASSGRNPVTGEQVVPAWVCRQVLSVMATCGMYDAAGDWMSNVGIPAKSGVSGGVLGALPGQVGIGVFSPRLDEFGNSVRAVRACERLSNDMGLHLMQAPEIASTVLHGVVEPDDDGDQLREVRLQGTMHFAAAEVALRQLEQVPEDAAPVVLDLTRVSSANDVGRRMLREGVRRLQLDGHQVRVDDPNGVLDD